ncbi:cytochrome P450 [Actinomadura fulvescens]|uniref:cytochrome P450 n=1 Tax=Actinomadura fulvescens TaxID=46160 RepID=UPI00397D6A8E
MPPEFSELRAASPVTRVIFPTGHSGWLVSTYECVQKVLTDRRFSRAAINRPGAPVMRPIIPDSQSVLKKDGADHVRLRKLLAPAFCASAVQGLRAKMTVTAESLLDDMTAAGPPADLVAAFAHPLPRSLIFDVLGVPQDDHHLLEEVFSRLLSVSPDSAEEIKEARGDLDTYMTELIETKRTAPGDDLLSRLISAHDNEGRLSTQELKDAGWSVLLAGRGPLTFSIVNSILRLLRQPELMELLRSQPDLLPGAVEELLRMNPVAVGNAVLRIALEDVELGEVTIRAGEAVIPAILSANRDETVFPDADTFDIRRSPNPHLAFSKGYRYCLGARLARLQLQIALKALLTHFPNLALACAESELTIRNDRVFLAPAKLPVTW